METPKELISCKVSELQQFVNEIDTANKKTMVRKDVNAKYENYRKKTAQLDALLSDYSESYQECLSYEQKGWIIRKRL